MKKLLNFIFYFISGLFFLLGIASLFRISVNIFSVLVISIGVIILFLFLIYIKNTVLKFDIKFIKKFVVCILILFFVTLCLFSYYLRISPVTDLTHIISYATSMISNDTLLIESNYFSRYTNQIPLLMIVYFIFKVASVLGFSSLRVFAGFANSFALTLSAYFIYLIGKEIKDERAGLLSLIFFVLNPIFYMYSSYFYTDTLCMPFSLLGFYLLLKAAKENTYKKEIFYILSGLIFFIGFKIRVVAIILLLGFLVYIFCTKIKDFIKVLIPICIGLFLGYVLAIGVYSYFDVNLNENDEFPVTHWLMMGLNTEHTGGYSPDDYKLTLGEETYNEKIRANIDEIKHRLDNLGITGTVKLYVKKIGRTWIDGGYGVYAKLSNTENANILYQIFGNYGSYKFLSSYGLQIFKAFINLFFAYFVYSLTKKEKDLTKSIGLAILGAVIFYIFWEAGARYSLSFLPWMIIPIGSSFLDTHFKLNKKVKVILLFLLALLLIIGFYMLSIEKTSFNDVVIKSYRGNSSLKVGDNEIVQEFVNNKSFDHIDITFVNSTNNVNSISTFTLYYEDIPIFTENFTSADLSNTGVLTFKFDKQEKEGTYKFSIKNKSGTNTLSLNLYSKQYYTLLDNCKLFVNGEEIAGTLIFEVSEEKNKTLLPKSMYLLLGGLLYTGVIYLYKKLE